MKKQLIAVFLILSGLISSCSHGQYRAKNDDKVVRWFAEDGARGEMYCYWRRQSGLHCTKVE